MTPPAYVHPLCIRLHDTDAARVLFFGHLFRHAHDAYEGFMDQLGFPLSSLIGSGDPAAALPLPIVRATARYRRPLRLGDRVSLELRVAQLRQRSFALDYRFIGPDGDTCAEAQTVHCLAGPEPAALPPGLHRALARAMVRG